MCQSRIFTYESRYTGTWGMSAYSSPSSLLSAPSLPISTPVCSRKYFSRTFSRFCLPGPPLRGTKVPSHFRSRLATAVSRRGSYRDFAPFRKYRVFRSRIPSSKGIFASLRIPTVPRCFDMFSFLPEMQQTLSFGWVSWPHPFSFYCTLDRNLWSTGTPHRRQQHSWSKLLLFLQHSFSSSVLSFVKKLSPIKRLPSVRPLRGCFQRRQVGA